MVKMGYLKWTKNDKSYALKCLDSYMLYTSDSNKSLQTMPQTSTGGSALRNNCLLQIELSKVQNNHFTIPTAKSRSLPAEFFFGNVRSIYREPK